MQSCYITKIHTPGIFTLDYTACKKLQLKWITTAKSMVYRKALKVKCFKAVSCANVNVNNFQPKFYLLKEMFLLYVDK